MLNRFTLKTLRAMFDLRQADVAEGIAISAEHVARLETGKHKMSRKTEAKLIEFFGLTREEVEAFEKAQEAVREKFLRKGESK